MNKKIVFGSLFILSASLVLFVGCNPKDKSDNGDKGNIPQDQTQQPEKKSELKGKVEEAKKDVQKKVDDTKKYLDEKSTKIKESLKENPTPESSQNTSKDIQDAKKAANDALYKKSPDKNDGIEYSTPADETNPSDIQKDDDEMDGNMMDNAGAEQANEQPLKKNPKDNMDDSAIDQDSTDSQDNDSTDSTDGTKDSEQDNY